MFKVIWEIQIMIMDWNLRDKKKKDSLKKILTGTSIFFVILCFFAILMNNIYILFASGIGLVLVCALQNIDGLQDRLTDVRSFIGFSIKTIGVFFLLSIFIIFFFQSQVQAVIIIVWIFGPSIAYVLVTLFANMKMATLVNGVGTILLGILTTLLNLLDFVPINFIDYFFEMTNNSFVSEAFTSLQIASDSREVFNLMFFVLITPLFIMFASATAICFIKKYWIAKNNENWDIISKKEMRTTLLKLFNEKNHKYTQSIDNERTYLEWEDEVKRLKQKSKLEYSLTNKSDNSFQLQYNNGVEITCKKVNQDIVILNLFSTKPHTLDKNATQALTDFILRFNKRDIYLSTFENNKFKNIILFEEVRTIFYEMTAEEFDSWITKLEFKKSDAKIDGKPMAYLRRKSI